MHENDTQQQSLTWTYFEYVIQTLCMGWFITDTGKARLSLQQHQELVVGVIMVIIISRFLQQWHHIHEMRFRLRVENVDETTANNPWTHRILHKCKERLGWAPPTNPALPHSLRGRPPHRRERSWDDPSGRENAGRGRRETAKLIRREGGGVGGMEREERKGKVIWG